jgi:hypothetical protein
MERPEIRNTNYTAAWLPVKCGVVVCTPLPDGRLAYSIVYTDKVIHNNKGFYKGFQVLYFFSIFSEAPAPKECTGGCSQREV